MPAHQSTQARAAKTRGRRLPAPQRREHLLDVAAQMLLDDGFEALSMEGVAQRAGVSKGLGYVYFENAEELALALFDREVGAIYARVEEAMSTAYPFAVRLRRALRVYLDIVAERRGLFAILQTKLSGRRLTRTVRRRIESFVDFWSRQIQIEFDVAPAVAGCLASGVLSFADACGRSWQAGRITRQEMEDSCVAFLLAGLRGVLPARSRKRGRSDDSGLRISPR
jgi:AcrR family transcriptional regulator